MKFKFAAVFLLATVIMHQKSFAQLPHASLYVHALYASALDNSSQNRYNGGLGGVAGVTLGSKNSRAVASVGYTNFFADKNLNPLGNETYIPIKIGLRQNLPLVLSFLYLQGDAGVGFVSNKNTSGSDSRFAFDLGAGAHFAGLEAALVWDNFHEKSPKGESSWLTFQLGFNLGF